MIAIYSLFVLFYPLRFIAAQTDLPIGAKITIDACIATLGATRRRISHIFNILESVDIIGRPSCFKYVWHSTSRLCTALLTLKQADVDLNSGFGQDIDTAVTGAQPSVASFVSVGACVPNSIPTNPARQQQIRFNGTADDATDKVDGNGHQHWQKSAKRSNASIDVFKEPSLICLSQAFIQMFLRNEAGVFTIEEAGKKLLPNKDSGKQGETQGSCE